MPGSVKNKKRHQSKVLSKVLSKKLGIEQCRCPEKAQMYIALWGKSTLKPYLVRVIEVEEDSFCVEGTKVERKVRGKQVGPTFTKGELRPFKVRILYHNVSEQCTCDPNIRSENRSFSDESDDNSESDRGPYPEEGVDEMSTFGLETGMY